MTELLLISTTSGNTTYLDNGEIIFKGIRVMVITQLIWITIICLTQVTDTKW